MLAVRKQQCSDFKNIIIVGINDPGSALMDPLTPEFSVGLVYMSMNHEAGTDGIQKCIEACKASVRKILQVAAAAGEVHASQKRSTPPQRAALILALRTRIRICLSVYIKGLLYSAWSRRAQGSAGPCSARSCPRGTHSLPAGSFHRHYRGCRAHTAAGIRTMSPETPGNAD